MANRDKSDKPPSHSNGACNARRHGHGGARAGRQEPTRPLPQAAADGGAAARAGRRRALISAIARICGLHSARIAQTCRRSLVVRCLVVALCAALLPCSLQAPLRHCGATLCRARAVVASLVCLQRSCRVVTFVMVLVAVRGSSGPGPSIRRCFRDGRPHRPGQRWARMPRCPPLCCSQAFR